jgi:hypothetical protein
MLLVFRGREPMGGRMRLRPPWQYDRFSSHCPSWRCATHVAPMQDTTVLKKVLQGLDACAEDDLMEPCVSWASRGHCCTGQDHPPKIAVIPVWVSASVFPNARSALPQVLRMMSSAWRCSLTGRDPGTAEGEATEIICRLFSQSAKSNSQGDPRTGIAALLA